MQPVELQKGIYWVGAVDWDIRNFHGYSTRRGTTYNSYLVVDEKIILVDTVKDHFADQMLSRIEKVIDPSRIDYIISNHVEMDHSGSIERVLGLAESAELVTSVQGEKGLKRHFKKEWPFLVMKSGDTLDIGSESISFLHMPMVHWPDSMASYIGGRKILFPNDAFGQHIASAERYDDELGWSLLSEEAEKYYANIVMPYGKQVEKVLGALAGLDISLICPSHGITWRSHINDIMEKYKAWSSGIAENKALIIYDSMWGSTEKLAYALASGLEKASAAVSVRSLKANHISDVITELNSSAMILIGSPTLNNGMLPSMGAFITYMKGLKPKKKTGFVFGSYGWGGQAVPEIAEILNNLGWDMPIDPVNINYIPDDSELELAEETGRKLGEMLNDKKTEGD